MYVVLKFIIDQCICDKEMLETFLGFNLGKGLDVGTCGNDCPGVRGIEVGIGFGIVASAIGIAGW